MTTKTEHVPHWASRIQSAIETLQSLANPELDLGSSVPVDALNGAIRAFSTQSRYAKPVATAVQKDPVSQVYFDYALTGILETDETWKIQRANQAAASLTGYETNQLTGLDFTILATEDERPRLDRHLVFLKEQGISQSSWHMIRKDGKTLILDIASIQVDEHQFIHVFDDVTELREASEAMQQAVIRADEANRTKSQFLANISHELRTPLNGLIGLSRLLAATSLDDKQREFVNKIHLSSVNLLHIVNDLLDIAKLETGKMQYEDIPFTLQQLQDDLSPTFALTKDNPNLTVTIAIDDTVPAVLQGDRYRIAQCLINLIGNAIKFTPAGTITLTVTTQTAADKEPQLVFCVTDTRIGIPAEVIPRLFQLFSQADASTTRRFGGTGLGLAITRQIAIDLHGDLTVVSEEGKGSLFTLTLPLRTAQAAPAFELEPVLDAPQEFSGSTILIAEDNEVNQIVIQELLHLGGIHTQIAQNGHQLLQCVQALPVPPDAILMDVQMPEMDGLTATQTLRAQGLTVPIIGLSAGASKEEQTLCFDVGMNDFISKPIDPDELWGCLTRWVKPKQTPDVSSTEPVIPIHQTPIYQKALQAFIRQHEADAAKLAELIAANDCPSVRKLAHSLKGASALMGFEQIKEIATSLEQQAVASDDVTALAGFIPRLQRALADAIPPAQAPNNQG